MDVSLHIDTLNALNELQKKSGRVLTVCHLWWLKGAGLCCFTLFCCLFGSILCSGICCLIRAQTVTCPGLELDPVMIVDVVIWIENISSCRRRSASDLLLPGDIWMMLQGTEHRNADYKHVCAHLGPAIVFFLFSLLLDQWQHDVFSGDELSGDARAAFDSGSHRTLWFQRRDGLREPTGDETMGVFTPNRVWRRVWWGLLMQNWC